MDNQPEVTIKIILNEFWKGIKPHKRMFWVCVISFTIVELIVLIVPVFYKNFFDYMTAPAPEANKLVSIIILIAAIHAANWLFNTIAHLSLIEVEARVISRLKQNAFDYLMLHSRDFFVNNFSGALVQKINRFSRSFEMLMDAVVFHIIPISVAVVGAIAITLFIAPLLSAIIAVWTLSIVFVDLFFSKWRIKYDIDAARADTKTTGTLSDSIVNYSSIKLFNGYRRETEKFKAVSNEQAKKQLRTWRLSETFHVIQEIFVYVAEFAVFYYAILLWQDGKAMIGTFVMLQVYIIGITHQLWGINQTFRAVYQGFADSKEMVEIMASPHEIKNAINAKELKNAKGRIEFKNVNFSFNETRSVLKDINLIINPGEKVALVGPSGTGKTTFTGLLLRLFEPASGAVLIDGQNIQGITLESLRANISLVPQDPTLFHRSIMENIRYGKPEATDDEVIAASKLAHCDEFVDLMPLKYETLVGERGVKLSGGERQRVAIARAILKNAPILVLDEATSSLDSQSEMLIQDALDKLMAKCTTIAIAHRLSTIRKMDRIIVMGDGRIVEEGTHQGLIRKKKSIYKNLWTLQAGGFIK